MLHINLLTSPGGDPVNHISTGGARILISNAVRFAASSRLSPRTTGLYLALSRVYNSGNNATVDFVSPHSTHQTLTLTPPAKSLRHLHHPRQPRLLRQSPPRRLQPGPRLAKRHCTLKLGLQRPRSFLRLPDHRTHRLPSPGHRPGRPRRRLPDLRRRIRRPALHHLARSYAGGVRKRCLGEGVWRGVR